MDAYGGEYATKFQDIIASYVRCEESLKSISRQQKIEIYPIDSLAYIDIESLMCVLGEVLDEKLPKEMGEYLRQVLFVEKFVITRNDVEEVKELICVNYINNSILLRCKEWLEEHNVSSNRIFQDITFSQCESGSAEEYAQGGVGGKIGNMFPYGGSWGSDDVDEIFKIAQSGDISYKTALSDATGHKQRGKMAPVKSDTFPDRPFICEMRNCSRAFKRLEHLKRHLKMHTGERPFKCNFPGCRRSFSRSDNLNSHYKVHSTTSRRGYCKFEAEGENIDNIE